MLGDVQVNVKTMKVKCLFATSHKISNERAASISDVIYKGLSQHSTEVIFQRLIVAGGSDTNGDDLRTTEVICFLCDIKAPKISLIQRSSR